MSLPTQISRRYRIFSFSKHKKLFGPQRLKFTSKRFNTTSGHSGGDVTIQYRRGFPVISVKLPSLKERCSFTLHPITSTVGQFLEDLKAEDKTIDTAVVHGHDDTRVASSTRIDHLLLEKFKLTINDVTYEVQPPEKDASVIEDSVLSNEIKHQVAMLHSSLNVDQFRKQKRHEAMENLESLKMQLEPLEKMKQDIEDKATFRTNVMVWGGLAYMGVQFGILARLTWWEYSWDIMEPVTYFITYGSAMLMYGYFILTRQEFVYPDARGRQYLRFLHKAARKSDFDVSTYNSLCSKIAQAEDDLIKLSGSSGDHTKSST